MALGPNDFDGGKSSTRATGLFWIKISGPTKSPFLVPASFIDPYNGVSRIKITTSRAI